MAAPTAPAAKDNTKDTAQQTADTTKADLERARVALGDVMSRIGTEPSADDKAKAGAAIQDYVNAVNARQSYIVSRMSALGADLKEMGIAQPTQSTHPVAVEYVSYEAEFTALDAEAMAYRPTPFYQLAAAQTLGEDEDEYKTLASNCDENFDSLTPPAIPAFWVAVLATGIAGDQPWKTVASNADTSPNSAFAADPNHTTDNRLDTRPLSVTSSAATVTFRRNQNTEASFDGMVLEISINGGAFQDILAAGGSFSMGGYNGTSSGGPLSGRQLWTGSSGGYVTSSATLPASANGQNVVLRWRVGTDGSVGSTGVNIDSIVFTGVQCLPQVNCGERFDLVTSPSLPTGWSAAAVSGTLWTTATSPVDTSPNAASNSPYVNNEDSWLDSRPIPVVSPSATVTFRRNNITEAAFDGMVLEISIGGGPFQDIKAAGGTIPVGDYNSTLASYGNRPAWGGNSMGFQTTTANLPAAANGQLVVLRWRFLSDPIVVGTGAWVDTITTTGTRCDGCAIVPPANVTVSNTTGQCGAVVNYPAPTTMGPCGTPTCTPPSGSFFPVGTTTVTCSATDQNGGTSSATFTVKVNDTQPPALTCPAPITVSANANCQAAIPDMTTLVTASDNCGSLGFAQVPQPGTLVGLGQTTIFVAAVDGAGNQTQCSTTFTVVDTTPPVIGACPANITVNGTSLNGCNTQAVVTYTPPTATDNCSGVTVACVPASGSTFPEGTTTVTCTATDAGNNTSSCSFTVRVRAPFGVCVVGDGTGDTFSQVVDRASPLYGFWRYRVAATGLILCGRSNIITYTPGRSLISTTNNSPTVYQNANINFGSRSGTVTVTDYSTQRTYTLRDANTANDPPCP